MVFLRNKQSDFWRFSPDKAKTAPLGTVFKNGAASKKSFFKLIILMKKLDFFRLFSSDFFELVYTSDLTIKTSQVQYLSGFRKN